MAVGNLAVAVTPLWTLQVDVIYSQMFPYEAAADARLKAAQKAAQTAERALEQEKDALSEVKAANRNLPEGAEKALGRVVIEQYKAVILSKLAYCQAMWKVYKAVVVEALPRSGREEQERWKKLATMGEEADREKEAMLHEKIAGDEVKTDRMTQWLQVAQRTALFCLA
jgi:hypothetical protein